MLAWTGFPAEVDLIRCHGPKVLNRSIFIPKKNEWVRVDKCGPVPGSSRKSSDLERTVVSIKSSKEVQCTTIPLLEKVENLLHPESARMATRKGWGLAGFLKVTYTCLQQVIPWNMCIFMLTPEEQSQWGWAAHYNKFPWRDILVGHPALSFKLSSVNKRA